MVIHPGPRPQHLWLSRGARWVSSAVYRVDKVPRAIRLTNVSDSSITIPAVERIGMWLMGIAYPGCRGLSGRVAGSSAAGAALSGAF